MMFNFGQKEEQAVNTRLVTKCGTGRRALTLIEVMIAVAILGVALIKMITTIHEQYRRTQVMADTRVYADRAQDIMVNLIERVPYRVIRDAMESGGLDASSPIRPAPTTPSAEPGDNAELVNNADAIEFDDLRTFDWEEDGEQLRFIEVDGNDDNNDTLPGQFKIDGNNRTYFQSKGHRYYFSLSLSNQPMYMYYRPHVLAAVPPDDRPATVQAQPLRYEPALTLDGDAQIYRDMLVKIVLTISWEAFGSDNSYSYVTYRANLGDDYENE